MKFGAVPTPEAIGAILAHTLRLPDDTRLAKGRVLGAEDIERIARAGIGTLFVAQPEAGDVGEDAAAQALAASLCGPRVSANPARTGRANLIAGAAGLVQLDPARILALNSISEALTVATVRPDAAVSAGQIVATIKVIPYAVSQADLSAAQAIAAAPDQAPVLSVAPFQALRAGLIMTQIDGGSGLSAARLEQVMAARLSAVGGTLQACCQAAHAVAPVAEAIQRLHERQCSPILILGAAATSDRADTVPEAIVRAGGRILHFGLPVDPGNLLLLARLGDTPVVGVPTCARSPSLNGFDLVLRRLAAGLALGRTELAAMGCGGLLSDSPGRAWPRRAPPSSRAAARLGAIILAAGQSRRMAGRNKLLEPFRGKVLVRYAVEAALEAGFDPVIVVTGHEATRIESALAGTGVTLAHNPQYAEGIGSSLRRGIEALQPEPSVAGACVLLADMPEIGAQALRLLRAAFDAQGGDGIIVPTHQGRWGNPLIWPRSFFASLCALGGDRGARPLAEAHGGMVTEVALDEEAVLRDFDTPEAFIDAAP